MWLSGQVDATHREWFGFEFDLPVTFPLAAMHANGKNNGNQLIGLFLNLSAEILNPAGRNPSYAGDSCLLLIAA